MAFVTTLFIVHQRYRGVQKPAVILSICTYLHILLFNQVHLMERCLEAVELVQLIALNVCGIRDLLHLVLVCTRMAGPALEELWKRNNDFKKLLHCLLISGDKLIVRSISSWCKLYLYSNIL
jgi:hypothetical protein